MSISRVQANIGRAAANTTITVTLTSGVTQGNLLIAELAIASTSATPTTPSGWTLVDNSLSSSNPNVYLYYQEVSSGLAGTTAFTFTISASANIDLNVSEWNSTTGWQASPLDKHANNTNSTASTTVSSGTTATTTQASELWVAGMAYKNSVQTESGLTSGWTDGLEQSNGPSLEEVYQIASATGAAGVSFTVPSAVTNAGVVATFMPASAANPALSTSPTSMSFSAGVGGSNPASQNDTLSETNGVPTAWTSSISYSQGSGWLSISPTSGNLAAKGSATITVSCATGSLAVGTYNATITFTATTGGATATITVAFTINNPALSTSPTSMTFSAGLGGSNPANQNDTLSELNGAPTAWTSSISYHSGQPTGWLSISPSSGNLTGGGNTTITVSASLGSLSAGTYNGTITFTATTGGATATITVTFTITAPALSTSPTSLSFSATVGGANPASQNDTLSETNGVATAWTSAINYGSGSGWLSASPSSGNLTANGQNTIAVSCATGSLSSGTYTATITFTATTGGATATISVTFQVQTAANPQVTPTNLTFSANAGGLNPAAQGVTLKNTGQATGNWTANTSYGSGSGWVTANPSSGTGLTGGSQVSVTITCTTGSLPTGTYTATITFSMGSNNAVLNVTFVIGPPAALIIKLAGQDITDEVDQQTVHIDDTLGQGAGAGSSGSTQGRATTIKFNTSLGPMNRAYGAGETLPQSGGPFLVRQGEIQVYNEAGTIVFGGYATKYTDTTTSQIGNTVQNFTTVEGIDYSTSLQRTLVYESFSGETDIYIIRTIIQKYTPWINLQYLPSNPSYTFELENFFNVTVEQVLQTVAGITGFLVYVDFYKNLHYVSPTTASSAPFNISDNPDFVLTFPHRVTEFMVDDNSAINRVFFYGGTQLSNNFTQDLSPAANGSNTVFILAYSPTVATDGNFDVTVNGVAQVVGTSGGTGPANTLKSQGGTADCLIDTSARTLTFSTAPASGATVHITYRYEYPLSLVLTDQNSYNFFGAPYLDGFINDSTVFDINTAIQRCKILLAQQSFGLTTLKLDVWKGGLQAGMVIQVTNIVRGISGTYLVQEVEVEFVGGLTFVYHVTLGAWNWGLIDFLLKLPTLSTFQDNTNTSQQTVVIEQTSNFVEVHDSWSHKTTSGPYYSRTAPVGDGHDAYPGFFTISS